MVVTLPIPDIQQIFEDQTQYSDDSDIFQLSISHLKK